MLTEKQFLADILENQVPEDEAVVYYLKIDIKFFKENKHLMPYFLNKKPCVECHYRELILGEEGNNCLNLHPEDRYTEVPDRYKV